MLEKYLIRCCSPTLASIKTGNLFNYPLKSGDDFDGQVARWSELLEPKGVSLAVLRRSGQSALVYVYRRSRLEAALRRRGIAEFLETYGYGGCRAEPAVAHLRERIAQSECFPHEIGVFLGYPLEDVREFIRNSGRNCKCCGCWKVYCNEDEAVKTFAMFEKCSSAYDVLWRKGKSVVQLTVAA